ncbi:hypothetical protein TL16_g11085 [Triparma laevis f. inornata]|uniref:CN hydrolase domain-containing protein n=1 Tax=Triparma laevis f. inornata TaxID=1714386 RepID=A0A9W7BHX4_9STRA|nr:hypothetical protein TL16_g11085 [Triparma laevis f. inornata]
MADYGALADFTIPPLDNHSRVPIEPGKCGAIQTKFSSDIVNQVTRQIHDAVQTQGCSVLCLQELFLTPYFCQSQNPAYFDALTMTAPSNDPAKNNAIVNHFLAVSKQYCISLVFSFYEKTTNGTLYNSVSLLEDGTVSPQIYRKTHIPDGPGYQEKFYFTPGDTGPVTFKTNKNLTIGVGICWDQWFPELARCMVLKGADVLFYPTAIGSEPVDGICADLEGSVKHWRRVMMGHAAANMVPILCCNRVGAEKLTDTSSTSRIEFYGQSFTCDNTGEIVQTLNNTDNGLVTLSVDPSSIKQQRMAWGMFRDRRPECYSSIRTKDGTSIVPGA